VLETKLDIASGIRLWPSALDTQTQRDLIAEIYARVDDAPFYRPVMPKTAKPFSVEETNLGPLGWISDARGYRYDATHPLTGKPWPAIPRLLFDIWDQATNNAPPPQCCLVNLYREAAKMGLHQDRNENAMNVPVLSVSLGDDALFRIGGTSRKGPTKSVRLRSGDVLTFGGSARLAFHGIDRIIPGTSGLVPGGGRINLTLRRVVP